MYNPKFNYISLNRDTVSGQRRYTTPDGEKLPSVTTILDATKSKESKEALANWRKAIGEAKAKQITTEAANRGTKMHTFLELYIKDGVIKELPGNIFHHPSWHMAKEVITKGLVNCEEFWGIEVPLYFPKLYAGTTDCVGIHKGEPSIIDFKQTNKPKKREWIEDYFTQLLFYATAHNEVHKTDIKKGVIMMCVKPQVDDNAKIVSQPEYQEFILEGDEWKFYEQKMWNRLEQYYLL